MMGVLWVVLWLATIYHALKMLCIGIVACEGCVAGDAGDIAICAGEVVILIALIGAIVATW